MANVEKTQPVAETEEKKVLDFTNLEVRLEELDSKAFIRAERECRMDADMTPDIVYSNTFCARLVAKAMGVTFNDIKALKLPQFVAVTARTRRFLLQSLEETILSVGN